MPTYRITDPLSGVTLQITGDTPPSEAELEEIFREMNLQQTASEHVGAESAEPPKTGSSPGEAADRNAESKEPSPGAHAHRSQGVGRVAHRVFARRGPIFESIRDVSQDAQKSIETAYRVWEQERRYFHRRDYPRDEDVGS